MKREEIERRIAFWEDVLDTLKTYKTLKYHYICICWAIDGVYHKHNLYPALYGITLKTDYPEFWKYKPKRGWCVNSGYWWSPEDEEGYEKRITVVNKIIKDLTSLL